MKLRVLSYEFCKSEIKKYKHYNDLYKTDPSIINKVRKNGWYELVDGLERQQHKPYTEKEILREAKKYKKRVEFQKGSVSHYAAAKRLGIFEKATKHMGRSAGVKKYSKEEILKSARKWGNQRDWGQNDKKIYLCAKGYDKKNGSDEDREFWEMCISHMEYLFKPNGYWTYERTKEVSSCYDDIRIFKKEQTEVHKVIVREGWNDLIEHMVWTTPKGNIRYPPGYFNNKEVAREEALKYKTRSEIEVKCRPAYDAIYKNGWGEELFSHMERHATNRPRHIYCFVWEDLKISYVGLTCNWKRRKNDHLNQKNPKSAIYKTIEKYGQPVFKLLTTVPVAEQDSPKVESKWIKHYTSLGYTMLNRAKAGSLGGKISIWTKEKIWGIANNCKSMTEFYGEVGCGIISRCKTMGIFDEIVNKLWVDGDTKSRSGGWNVEDAMIVAKRYKSISKFQKDYSGAHKCLAKNSLLKHIFPNTKQ